MTNALFLEASAPSIGASVFDGAAAGFTLYYLVGATGFTSPTWSGYTSAIFWFSYTTASNQVTITHYNGAAPNGPATIPSTINGLPVTTIASSAFDSRTNLTGVTIPNTVTTIGDLAFGHCTSLTSVTIPNSVTSIGSAFFQCTGLTSVTISNTLTSIATSMFRGCTGLTRVTIPDSVTVIGGAAFEDCTGLTSITIPNGVTSIGGSAFRNTTSLKSAVFIGNAPTTGTFVFFVTASGFSVYYFNGATGFTSPNWTDSSGDTYPAVNMGAYSAIEPWLLSYGFAYNSNLLSDPNSDGVNLLMAYALNLDPTLNLTNSLPRPVLTPTQMSFTFYAGSAGVTYSVEASLDLEIWSTTGITISPPDANHFSTATVPRTGPRGFMRLKAVY